MNTLLAIESAIAGGSLSLIDENGIEVASFVGDDPRLTRAEELLPNINKLLSSAGIQKSHLTAVAVSAGPGSFTGIRAGMATALGMKNGLGIPMYSASVLEAMITAEARVAAPASEEHGSDKLLFCSAVPSGRGAVCVQLFEVGNCKTRELSTPMTLKHSELSSFIDEHEFHFLAHSDLMPLIESNPMVTDAGRNLAACIAVECFVNRSSTPPLFISKSF
jgi:tRNA threonylcarbamoyl adenosine modification protein YeaZ